MKRLLKPLNFNEKGFTSLGLVEYGKLRSNGIPSEKAIGMLIKEDKKTIKMIEKLKKVF